MSRRRRSAQANEPIIYPKPIEAFESVRSLIEGVVAFLNPRSIGRAVRLGRRWAEVGYDEPSDLGVPFLWCLHTMCRLEE